MTASLFPEFAMAARTASVIVVALAASPLIALAQAKPPVAQFWADVATHSLSIPGMGDMDEGGMGMF
ncbi:MAG: hypothetical protein B6D47_09140, partial [Rhodocyclaceae bacterium UTPRO2]